MSTHQLALFLLAILALAAKLVQLRRKPDRRLADLGPTFTITAFAALSLLWLLDARGITKAAIEWTLLGVAGASLLAAVAAMFVRYRSQRAQSRS